MSVNKVNSDGSTTLIAGATLWADSPIGTILAYGGATAPAGWFICQGQELTKTEYAELYAVIGDSFGTASVNTKFVLPDLREATTKGVGLTGKSNNHYDSDGLALGEFIDDRIQNHKHNIQVDNIIVNFSAIQLESGSNNVSNLTAGGTSPFTAQDIITGRSGNTTEVKAVGVNYIIKAKMVALPADLESAVEDAVEETLAPTELTITLKITGEVHAYKSGYVVNAVVTGSYNQFVSDWKTIASGLPAPVNGSAFGVCYNSTNGALLANCECMVDSNGDFKSYGLTQSSGNVRLEVTYISAT